MHSSGRQWKSVPSQDKRTLSPLIFYIQCYKTQAQSTWQISHSILLWPHWPYQHWSDPREKQVMTWQLLCRDNAPRLYLAWPTWWHQKCLYRNSWSHGEIVTAGLDSLCCWILSLCPGSKQSAWGALHTPQVRTFLLLHQGDSRWILHAGLSPDFLCIPPKARPQGGTGTPTQELGVSEAWQKFSSF